MRKIFLIFLAATMLFAAACSGSNGENSEPAISNNADTSVEISEENSSTASQSSITSGTTVPDSGINSENSFDTSAEIPEISSTVTASNQDLEQPTEKENTLSIEITVNGRTFSATLYDNETARAFSERLPLTLDMNELNGNEKYYYLSDDLPTNSSRPSKIYNGDIMLYGSECLVIFYESFPTSYSYTPIGKINDPSELAAALGSGSVQVKFNTALNN